MNNDDIHSEVKFRIVLLDLLDKIHKDLHIIGLVLKRGFNPPVKLDAKDPDTVKKASRTIKPHQVGQ